MDMPLTGAQALITLLVTEYEALQFVILCHCAILLNFLTFASSFSTSKREKDDKA